MNRVRMRLLAVAMGLVVAAPALGWKLAAQNEPYSHKASGYSIQFPDGWRWMKWLGRDETFATRDGMMLQRIYVDFRKHKQAFRSLRKDATPEMLPQELAEKYLADNEAGCSCQDVQILANEPTMLAGRPGFRVHVSFRNTVEEGSVRYQVIVAGANFPQGIFLVGYGAPTLHYFERDLGTFEQVLATFTVGEKPPAK